MIFGFIGVGRMGGPLARNLIRAGKQVLVYDIRPDAVRKTVDAGPTAVAAKTPGELTGVDALFTCLPLPEDVQEVMLDQGGLLSRMRHGAVHIDVSTIDPQTARSLESAAVAHGVGFLQCPLGKTPEHAERAEEPIFVGGRGEVYDRMKEVLGILGSPVYYLGGVEASSALKLISNIIGMSNLAVLAEGIRMGEKAGIEPKVLIELLSETGAGSYQMDIRGPSIARGDFSSRFDLSLALKDIRLGHDMAKAWGTAAATLRATLEYFKAAAAAGYGSEDCSAIYKIIK